MKLKELEAFLWGAAVYLRGVIDAGDYKQYIFPLLFYKRICDVYDEEYRLALFESDGDLDYASFAENHRFQIPENAHWDNVRAITVNVGIALSKAFHEIERVNAGQLQGIFGDAEWTNKERLTDAMLCNLIIYDPTCGSGGLLLNCAMMLKDAGKEYRTLRLYGQEINLITSAIARMNMLLHGFEEFRIERGDTLKDPRFMEFDRLQQFNVVLANPPYSIKSWDQKAFTNDPYGRNIWGTPPQGCADYAFQQHIMKSLNDNNGRCVVLWPHGILFRDAEREIRRKMIEIDTVDCVIGLGANLFYNSPMEACLLICRNNKPRERKGKILFINAVNEVKTQKAINVLEERHIQKIFSAYKTYQDAEGFAKVVDIADILKNNANLSIPLYVSRIKNGNEQEKCFVDLYEAWTASSTELRRSMNELFKMLEEK